MQWGRGRLARGQSSNLVCVSYELPRPACGVKRCPVDIEVGGGASSLEDVVFDSAVAGIEVEVELSGCAGVPACFQEAVLSALKVRSMAEYTLQPPPAKPDTRNPNHAPPNLPIYH